MKELLFSDKQWEFIKNSTRKWNLAHGSVRSGKTVGTLYRFMHAVDRCPDSDIWISGHSSTTIYNNVISLILNSDELSVFRPFCTWMPGKKELRYKDKTIKTQGAKDAGAVGNFQGPTFSLFYGDEMTLFPENIIDMIDTRLSKPHSMGIATMNPSSPSHKMKKWIDDAEGGDENYYSLHFTLQDNPFVNQEYKDRLKKSLSGVFYKRNYLGLWCLAEGAIFDFFDKSVHVLDRPPRAAEYWVAAIDYGSVNPFVCLLIGVSTGKYEQLDKCFWVEKEYYWDPKKSGRQKTNTEFCEDVCEFLEPYGVNKIYIDPSAEAISIDLRRSGFNVIKANNDVQYGIQILCSGMNQGIVFIMSECKNTIREIEGYVWDSKAAEKGHDEPLKKNDHCPDALRYFIATHKVSNYDGSKEFIKNKEYMHNRFSNTSRSIF